MENLGNEDKELENIKIDEPVKFEPENELANNFDNQLEPKVRRVGLEPVEPIRRNQRSSAGTKVLFVLLMLLSAAIGAYAVWLFMF